MFIIFKGNLALGLQGSQERFENQTKWQLVWRFLFWKTVTLKYTLFQEIVHYIQMNDKWRQIKSEIVNIWNDPNPKEACDILESVLNAATCNIDFVDFTMLLSIS